jgi:outer membrane protein TolC
MSGDDNKDLNNNSSSSSSSVGPAKVPSITIPIYSQTKLKATYRNARMEDRMDALDLSIGIKKMMIMANWTSRLERPKI